MNHHRRLSWLAFGLATAQVAAGAGLAFTPNPEGWLGGALFAGLYALPSLAIALMLRSSHAPWPKAAGWSGLALAVFYTAVVVLNWSGYSSAQAIFAVAITLPTVLVDALVFWIAAGFRLAARRSDAAGSRARPRSG